MADTETIIAALGRLDPTNDRHWLPDGSPRVAIVQALAHDQTIGVNAIRRAAPDFRRVAEPEPEPAVSVEPEIAVEPEPEPEPEPEEAVEAIDEPPPLSVNQAQALLVASQVRLRTAIDAQRAARARVGAALARWQRATGAVMTPEMAAREYIAASLADRAAGGGRRPKNAPGPSVVDQMAFGRPAIKYGKFGAWKRGSLSHAESARRLAEIRRAKLPSQR